MVMRVPPCVEPMLGLTPVTLGCFGPCAAANIKQRESTAALESKEGEPILPLAVPQGKGSWRPQKAAEGLAAGPQPKGIDRSGARMGDAASQSG